MSEATSGSNGRVTEYLATGDPACRYAHAGYWLQYFADAARASWPMMVDFASLRNSTPAPPKSLKLFGIVRHIGLVHARRQPLSRLR
jgi:hypothetical protein